MRRQKESSKQPKPVSSILDSSIPLLLASMRHRERVHASETRRDSRKRDPKKGNRPAVASVGCASEMHARRTQPHVCIYQDLFCAFSVEMHITGRWIGFRLFCVSLLRSLFLAFRWMQMPISHEGIKTSIQKRLEKEATAQSALITFDFFETIFLDHRGPSHSRSHESADEVAWLPSFYAFREAFSRRFDVLCWVEGKPIRTNISLFAKHDEIHHILCYQHFQQWVCWKAKWITRLLLRIIVPLRQANKEFFILSYRSLNERHLLIMLRRSAAHANSWCRDFTCRTSKWHHHEIGIKLKHFFLIKHQPEKS